jgi:uncharacterized metal-binding protein YceD (DUF177 family)
LLRQSEIEMAAEFGWSHKISEVPAIGLSAERHATPALRAEIAAMLDLIACERLDVRYEITPLSRGRYLLEGTLVADVTQSCVVTLEPVETHLVEPFEVEFHPGLPETEAVVEFDALETREVEPLEDDTIPVGRIVYEHLASALPAYPRKEGAVFEQPPEPEATRPVTSPFAILEQLKKPKSQK